MHRQTDRYTQADILHDYCNPPLRMHARVNDAIKISEASIYRNEGVYYRYENVLELYVIFGPSGYEKICRYWFTYGSIPSLVSIVCNSYTYIRALMQAYEEGVSYPKHMLITYGWYGSEWWKAKATSSQFNCTAEQRASILAYTLAPQVQESYTNLTTRDESGIVSIHYVFLLALANV